MFEAYITNTALYPLMGIEVGTTVHFPTTTQELQAALAKNRDRRETVQRSVLYQL